MVQIGPLIDEPDPPCLLVDTAVWDATSNLADEQIGVRDRPGRVGLADPGTRQAHIVALLLATFR